MTTGLPARIGRTGRRAALPAVLLSATLLGSAGAQAADAATTLGNWATSLAAHLPALTQFHTILAYATGLVFVVGGILALGAQDKGGHGGARERMTAPIISIIAGTALCALDLVLPILNISLFNGHWTPYAALDANAMLVDPTVLGAEGTAVLKAVYDLVQFIGILAIVRGFTIIRAVANGTGGSTGYGPGITHIVGGTCAANISAFIQVLKSTFGIQ